MKCNNQQVRNIGGPTSGWPPSQIFGSGSTSLERKSLLDGKATEDYAKWFLGREFDFWNELGGAPSHDVDRKWLEISSRLRTSHVVCVVWYFMLGMHLSCKFVNVYTKPVSQIWWPLAECRWFSGTIAANIFLWHELGSLR